MHCFLARRDAAGCTDYQICLGALVPLRTALPRAGLTQHCPGDGAPGF